MEQELSYSEIRKMFLKNYREVFVPFARTIERKKFNVHNSNMGKFCGIMIIVFVFCIMGSAIPIPIISKSFIFMSFLFLAPIFIITSFKLSNDLKKADEALEYKNKLKDIIMPKLMACVNLNWSRGKYNEEELNKAGIHFNQIIVNDTYYLETFDDVISGNYGGQDFELAERRIKTDDSGYLIFSVTFNKAFKSKTMIKGKGSLITALGLPKTTLEDVVFEKNFNVYTNDEIEARYLITPAFMERINNLKKTFNAELNGCITNDNKLFIILKTKKDLFEPFILNSPNDDAEQFFSVADEIISLFKLIDYMKLYLKIGL